MEKDKKKLTVVIIAKNEAEMIAGAIASLSSLLYTQIVVIDDYSTDRTEAIAKKMGAHIIKHHKKDFSEIRNFAQNQVTTPWTLYLDADERISVELSKNINRIIESDDSTNGHEIIRQNFYLGKKWPQTEKFIRLIKTSAFKKWQGELHETIQISGSISKLSGEIFHYTHRNLTEMATNTIAWSEVEAKLRFDQDHPPISWWRIPRVMVPAFWNYFITQGGWRVGTVGLIESIYQAFSIFITYARLWEIQQKLELSK